MLNGSVELCSEIKYSVIPTLSVPITLVLNSLTNTAYSALLLIVTELITGRTSSIPTNHS